MAERRPRQERVVVVGGGLSGLTAAHRITERARDERRPVEVVLLEARDRLGGAIRTDRVDGFTLEGGADGFITNKRSVVELCRRIGLEEQLVGTDPEHRRSFVVRDGRLLPMPEGFVLMVPDRLGPVLTTPVLSLRGKLRMLLDLVLPRKDDEADESVSSFVRRRLGREVLERLVQPLVSGVYAADPAELSLRAMLPRFLRMEASHGSLILAALREARRARSADRDASGARFGRFVTLADGMDTLPRALADRLPPGSVRLGQAVRRLSGNLPASPWLVELLDGPPIEADAVVLAVEAHASARMVDALDPALALQLRAIPYASTVVVNVAYRRDQVAHPLDGLGAVIPATEQRAVLAVSFLSMKFPRRAPAGTVLMRAFLAGATRPEAFDWDDEAIRAVVTADLASLLGARGEPLLIEVARHPRAMPQYTLGHLERVEAVHRLASRHPRLFLTGNAFDGASLPDVAKAAEAAADEALTSLTRSMTTAAA